MRIVTDSGSTKANWALVNDAGEVAGIFNTIGFNPFFHTAEFISKEIRKNQDLMASSSMVTEVFFYGAGCSSDHYRQIVAHGLMQIFDRASIHVDHDLVAAAYATFRGQPCISCIIGTGSNSCYFDGIRLYEEVPALAYILGDEGSGCYLGKRLLTDYLYKKLPPSIESDLEESYVLSKAIIFESVYQKPHANVYLASFAPFVAKHIYHPHFKQIVLDGMKLFLKNHVCCYTQYKTLPTYFIGSVAYHFENILREAAQELEVNVNDVIKQPLNTLVDYHINYLFTKQNA